MSNEAFFPRQPHHPIPQNSETYFGPNLQRLPTRFDARRFFIHHYDPIRRTLAAHQELGLALLVFADRPEPIAGHWIAAQIDRTTSTVLGRHSACAVSVLSTAQEVSLRHAVICVRAVSFNCLRARIFDLRTQFGFADETGRDLRGVTIDGTSFFRFGDLIVLALVTGEDPSSYLSAEDAYDAIPARIFVDAQEASPTDPKFRVLRPHSQGGSADERTFVRSQLGVLPPEADLLGPDELPEGQIHLTTSNGRRFMREVGRSALSRGLLFGRYDRCDIGRRGGNNELSRVHLLLVRDRGELLAIDTASSNGSFRGEKQFRQLKMESGMEIDLAGELVVRWVSSTPEI